MNVSSNLRTPLSAALAVLAFGCANGAQAEIRDSTGSTRGNVLTVNSLADNTTPGDGLVTLREAIIAANADGTTDLGQTGNGADIIDLSALSGTIQLGSSLPAISSDITLFGAGRDQLTISGDDGAGTRNRIFFIDGGDLQLIDLALRHGFARGGNGGTCQQRSGCGGGGAGLGGAIFARAGSAELQDVIFSGNQAERGAAGSQSGGNNAGLPGQGKGGALFILPGAVVTALALDFDGNSAADSSDEGYTPGVSVDTRDVHGLISDIDRIFAAGFESVP